MFVLACMRVCAVFVFVLMLIICVYVWWCRGMRVSYVCVYGVPFAFHLFVFVFFCVCCVYVFFF